MDNDKTSLVAYLAITLLTIFLAGCGATDPKPSAADRASGEVFESQDYFVVIARSGDTVESLAARFLADKNLDWMIEDYNGSASIAAGQQVVIPKRPWNLAGVTASGYQFVPILVYHNLASQPTGRMILGARLLKSRCAISRPRAIGWSTLESLSTSYRRSGNCRVRAFC